MFKTIFFLLYTVSAAYVTTPFSTVVQVDCDCPAPTNIQKTGSTSSSLTYDWTMGNATSQYTLWYFHQETGYTSPSFTCAGHSFTFSNLSPGHYTLFFKAECGDGSSGLVGIEDLVSL